MLFTFRLIKIFYNLNMLIALIKNGYIKNKASKSNGESILLKNTCPYDSIFQVIICAYCDGKNYRKYTKSKYNSITLYAIIKSLINNRYSKEFKSLRIKLLEQICKSEILLDNTISLNCESNTLYQHLMKKYVKDLKI